tara:strand:+ start:2585 stop:3124 length:540 start_codon:yes stop_codon:yes gene_type:complete
MSGYIHGGSALTLDIGVRNGTHTGGSGALAATAFVPGDWVAISAQPNSDGGYEAVKVACLSNTDAAAAQCVMPVGVVLGPSGMSYKAGSSATANDGGEFLVRVKGVATAKVTASGSITAPVAISRVNDQLHAQEQANRDFLGTAAHAQAWGILGCGVLMEDHGGSGVEQLEVYVTNNRI